MADYDKYYTTEDLFGDPYPELISFFKNYEVKGRLLDLGCGQGRNAIPLAMLGYEVSAIDNSKLGVDQMLTQAKKLDLSINGIVGDIYQFETWEEYGVVLLDSMFHFEKNDLKKESGFLENIFKSIQPGTLLCNCIQDTGSKVEILKSTIYNTNLPYKVLNDSSLIYNFHDKTSGHSSKTKYCMHIIRKG